MDGAWQVLIVVLYVGLWLVALATVVSIPLLLGVNAVRFVRRRMVAPPAMRVGDRERAAVAARLGDDYAAGRLALDELEARSAATWEARTYAQLAGVLADLPTRRPRRLELGDAYDALVGVGLLALASVTPWRLIGAALLLALLVSHADARRGDQTAIVLLAIVTALAGALSPAAGLLVAVSVALRALRATLTR
jgi:hypothetical protein